MKFKKSLNYKTKVFKFLGLYEDLI